MPKLQRLDAGWSSSSSLPIWVVTPKPFNGGPDYQVCFKTIAAIWLWLLWQSRLETSSSLLWPATRTIRAPDIQLARCNDGDASSVGGLDVLYICRRCLRTYPGDAARTASQTRRENERPPNLRPFSRSWGRQRIPVAGFNVKCPSYFASSAFGSAASGDEAEVDAQLPR